MIMWEQLDDLNFVEDSALLPRSQNQTQEKTPLIETTVSTLRLRNNEYWNIKTLFFFSHFFTCNNYIIYVIMDARVTRMVSYTVLIAIMIMCFCGLKRNCPTSYLNVSLFVR